MLAYYFPGHASRARAGVRLHACLTRLPSATHRPSNVRISPFRPTTTGDHQPVRMRSVCRTVSDAPRVCSTSFWALQSGQSTVRRFADEIDKAEELPEEASRATSGQSASSSAPTAEKQPQRKKGKRLTRAERGSWIDNPGLTDEVVKHAPVWPTNQPFYDVQGQAPWLLDLTNPVFEGYKRLKDEQPDLFASLHAAPPEEAPPRPGAQKLLHWEINVVFDMDPVSGETHPMNKKAKCRVFLRDLQREFGLSDAALQYIALICGPRYDPRRGLLTLTAERYAQREDNRRHIVEILHKLVAEGERAHPNLPAAAAAGD